MSDSPDQPVRFDFATLATQDRYKLLSFTVVPRPIAWVSTLDPDGRCNLAPFSFFNIVATDPPLLAMGITARPHGKDTARNIRSSAEFVVHLVPHALIHQMNVSAIEFPPEIDEIAAAGLETVPSSRVRPPRLAGSPVAYECRTWQMLDLPSGQSVIIGEVLVAHIAERAVIDAARCHIDTGALDLVGRMDNRYIRSGEVFDLPRITLDQWRANPALASNSGQRAAGAAAGAARPDSPTATAAESTTRTSTEPAR